MDEFIAEITEIIEAYGEDLTCAEAIGALEIIKFDLFEEMTEPEEEEEIEEDDED